MSFDWTRISDDPNNREAKAEARALLRRLRKLHTDTDLTGLVERVAASKPALDIGMSAHHLVKAMAGLSRNLKFLAWRLGLASVEYSFTNCLLEFSLTER